VQWLCTKLAINDNDGDGGGKRRAGIQYLDYSFGGAPHSNLPVY